MTSPALALPGPRAPLAARVSLETDRPTRLTLHIDDGEKTTSFTPSEAFATEHSVPVLGLRANRLHTIALELTDEQGVSTTLEDTLSVATDVLPEIFPPVDVSVARKNRMEPGVTMFNALFTHPVEDGSERGLIIIVDDAGEVVWLYEAPHRVLDLRVLSNGNLLYIYDQRGIVELDMTGEVVEQWWAANLGLEGAPEGAILVDTDLFHHEVIELPEEFEGDFAVLSSEARPFPNYPADESDLSVLQDEALVVGDVVVEFKRDGTIVKEWKLLDLLDPYRISYGSLRGFHDDDYGVETKDWAHGNAVILDAVDDAFIVSARTQEAVVKIDRETSEVVWILGAHDQWFLPWSDDLLDPIAADGSPIAPDEFGWSYHQHAPMPTPEGGLLIFDNGNGRAVPPDAELPAEEQYSRAVEYLIDEEAGTVQQVWAYGGPDDPWFSRALGDADVLPETGNVLVTDGARRNADGQAVPRLVEVTREDPPEVVFEMFLRDESKPPFNWIIYRAERLPSLYPGAVTD